jgi:hypothetical protein
LSRISVATLKCGSGRVVLAYVEIRFLRAPLIADADVECSSTVDYGWPGAELRARLRAPAATNALDHEADIATVQEWPGHANIATTRLYDRRRQPGDLPTFRITY